MSAGESCGPFWGALLTTPHIGIQTACGANFAGPWRHGIFVLETLVGARFPEPTRRICGGIYGFLGFLGVLLSNSQLGRLRSLDTKRPL